MKLLRDMADVWKLSNVLPALESRIVRHPPEVFELGHDPVHDGETGEHSRSTGLVDHV